MEYICHRVNKREELRKIPPEYGVEIDVRDDVNGNLYLSHDPYVKGENFEEYLKEYCHGTMILNIKSERVEWKALELLRKYHVKKYFFLDSSFPMMIGLSNAGEYNTAVRISEYESLETARLMKGRANWIWMDCFTKIPINAEEAQELKRLGYRLCLVSPELQGRPQDIGMYATLIKELGIDAICTKTSNISIWNSFLFS